MLRRADPPEALGDSLWHALSSTAGVGFSVTDAEGRLLFVNDTTQALFSGGDVPWRGKTIADFHPPEFVAERLAMICRVIAEQTPLSIRHIYRGSRIESTVWPILDDDPPHDRVLVVSRPAAAALDGGRLPAEPVGRFDTRLIDLGPLDALTSRELEVLAFLGHGMTVPEAARAIHRSPHTVQRHKEAIGRKLGVSTHADLVGIVASLGLDLEDTRLHRIKR